MQAPAPAGYQATSPRTRPTGVTILAILEFLGALVFLVGGLGLVAAGGLIASPLAMGLGGVMAVLGIVGFVVGYGLWSLQPWALMIAMIFTFIGIVVGAAQVALGNVGSVVSILIDVLILYYLTRPGVKAAFGTH